MVSGRAGIVLLLYSWHFSHYSPPIHWLVHGHMTSNNETVSCQIPWAGNIAKTMTSNGKQFTVTREVLTTVACDGWNLSAVFKFCVCFVLLYNKSLNDWSLGEEGILLPSNLNVSLDFVSGNTEILGKQNSLFPSGPVIKCNYCLTCFYNCYILLNFYGMYPGSGHGPYGIPPCNYQ